MVNVSLPAKFPCNNPSKLPKQVSNVAIMGFGDDFEKQVLLMKYFFYIKLYVFVPDSPNTETMGNRLMKENCNTSTAEY